MRVPLYFQCLLANLLVVSLFTCFCATAFHLDFLSNSLSDRIFGRSLPGSLVTAPQGAIGYQPPPGPVVNEAQPTKTHHPKVYKTITTTIVTREISHELRQAPFGMSNSSAPHGHRDCHEDTGDGGRDTNGWRKPRCDMELGDITGLAFGILLAYVNRDEVIKSIQKTGKRASCPRPWNSLELFG
ncbi:uncharacterized protein ACLA_047330 [Aspergillus clavatus NRRL 1]|uniref:Uncharacterized protein n=1 Tax=Aspergillus clavatus (strain ATCC 1007 / CBS 513.65 / DSM 816 / NCTC 3887 / NRRL 1 / QM 1276 / 107) TaxID=344612 RepID=A1CHA9_ASPCL|nr:uncharacterized protein ACLA_047330 [Aspergillus clavatus NRRL 1]EAW10264.1 conserved hypothetical protein [Aspergillus clavatus NRRL 1]